MVDDPSPTATALSVEFLSKPYDVNKAYYLFGTNYISIDLYLYQAKKIRNTRRPEILKKIPTLKKSPEKTSQTRFLSLPNFFQDGHKKIRSHTRASVLCSESSSTKVLLVGRTVPVPARQQRGHWDTETVTQTPNSGMGFD